MIGLTLLKEASPLGCIAAVGGGKGGWNVATMGIRVEPLGRTGTRQLGTVAVRHRRVTTIVVVVIYIFTTTTLSVTCR